MDTSEVLKANPLSIQISQEFYDDLDRRIRKAVADAIGVPAREEPKPEKYLTRKQVCQMLNISLPTLYSYTQKGLLRGSKLGNRVVFSEQQIKDSLHDLPVRFSMR